AAFNAEHTRLYGYAADAPIELVTLRATARLLMSRPLIDSGVGQSATTAGTRVHRNVHFSGVGYVTTPVYDRDVIARGTAMVGPLIIEQMDTTTVVFPGQNVECDTFGNLILRSS